MLSAPCTSRTEGNGRCGTFPTASTTARRPPISFRWRWGGSSSPKPSCAPTDHSAWGHSSASYPPTSTSTTSHCSRTSATTEPCGASRPSTWSPTTPTVRAATASSARTATSGPSTTRSASTPSPSCAPSSGTSGANPSPITSWRTWVAWPSTSRATCVRSSPTRSARPLDGGRPRLSATSTSPPPARRGGPIPGPWYDGLPERAPVEELSRLIELGDLDELTRHVERLCDAGDWNGLVELRERARAALQRGKQLWPAASLAEYRLALEAPGPWAASVLVPGAGRFALGPLPEVAASRHPWSELAPHVPPGPLAAVTAHERVVRGEDLRADDRIDRTVLELPLA